MKDTELKLIAELMKNSRRSDRELAHALKISQPTVSRTRIRLEKEGYIREYTIVPAFEKLGFQVASVILIKLRQRLSAEEVEKARQISLKDMAEKAPEEIVLFTRGMGDGYTGVLVAFHRNYSGFTQLLNRIREYPFVDHSATLSFLVDLTDPVQYRYLTFSTLAEYLLTPK